MKFFGVHIEDLESERFLSASNDQIATWLFGHALCCKQCNGGVIADASTMPARFWLRHGIDIAILSQPSPLWSWDGASLRFEPYDINGQTVYERKVAGGRTRAKQRWGNTPASLLDSSPISTPNAPEITQPNSTQPEKNSSNDESIVLFAEEPPAKKSKAKGTIEELKAFALEIGLPESDGENCFHKWESTGWKGIQDWKAKMRTWKLEGFHASQKTSGPNGSTPRNRDLTSDQVGI